MAAHVFDATEPTLGSAQGPVVRNSGPATTTSAAGAPMFAAQPAVFQRVHERSKVGAGPVIGLVVGAVLIGGLIYGANRHHQETNAATTGIHATSQSAAMTPAATAPAPSPSQAIGTSTPAPAAAPAPKHLSIVAAPPRPAAPVHVARAVTHARTAVRTAPAAAPERTTVTPPAPMAITPAAPPAAAPAPALSTPAPQPTPEPAPVPAAPAPDAGSATPQ